MTTKIAYHVSASRDYPSKSSCPLFSNYIIQVGLTFTFETDVPSTTKSLPQMTLDIIQKDEGKEKHCKSDQLGHAGVTHWP